MPRNCFVCRGAPEPDPGETFSICFAHAALLLTEREQLVEDLDAHLAEPAPEPSAMPLAVDPLTDAELAQVVALPKPQPKPRPSKPSGLDRLNDRDRAYAEQLIADGEDPEEAIARAVAAMARGHSQYARLKEHRGLSREAQLGRLVHAAVSRPGGGINV